MMDTGIIQALIFIAIIIAATIPCTQVSCFDKIKRMADSWKEWWYLHRIYRIEKNPSKWEKQNEWAGLYSNPIGFWFDDYFISTKLSKSPSKHYRLLANLIHEGFLQEEYQEVNIGRGITEKRYGYWLTIPGRKHGKSISSLAKKLYEQVNPLLLLLGLLLSVCLNIGIVGGQFIQMFRSLF